MNINESLKKVDFILRYGSIDNLISKNVANFIDLFIQKGQSKAIYVPYKLVNSLKGNDEDSDYKHVSDQLMI